MSDEADPLAVQVAAAITDAIVVEKAKIIARGDRFMTSHIRAAAARVLATYRITKRHAPKVKTPTAQPLTDEQWMAELERKPAYEGIDVRREWSKCETWCGTARVKISRRRFVNWLNKVEQPMGPGKRRGAARADVYTEPEGWRDVLRRIGAKWDREKVDDLCRTEWPDLSGISGLASRSQYDREARRR